MAKTSVPPGGVRETKAQILEREMLDELEKDELLRDTLGDHTFEHFPAAKREEGHDYIRHVSPWEVER